MTVVLFVCYAPEINRWFFPPDPLTLSEEDLAVLEDWKEQAQTKAAPASKNTTVQKFHRPASKFNPNHYSVADWQKLGLSKKQADIIRKFSAYGLRSNADLQKIYVLPSELFELIKDSTFFEQEISESLSKKPTKVVVRIDLNTASRAQLIALPGIGEYLADRILERRKALGGFVSLNQLKEIKYLDQEKIGVFSEFVLVDTTKISPINLNEATFQQLKSHPYINSNLANNLVKMREQKKGFYRIEEIQESALIDSELFQKIKPYISL